MTENKKRNHIRFEGAEPEFEEVDPDANNLDEPVIESDDLTKKWFQLFDEHTSDDHGEEKAELKIEELNTLRKKASSCFEVECHKQKKNNPSDNKWLLTALDKGTSKDSANAGIVLVQSNPLSNLEALKKVVNMTNVKSKTSVDTISLVSQLFLESLLPAYRKLRSIEKRASDWKTLKAATLDQATKDKVLAYWHYEDELKGYYGDFCNNLAQQLQHGKEPNKLKAIHATASLLIHSPEREIQLLPMLINKFGDPNRTVTNKLLETMRYLAKTHSRMCSVIAREIEKLLFRNNTSERGQHYALAFLSLMARYCDRDTAQVLVRICLAFFKIKTELGAVNTRTMQRILACFRVVITEAADMATVKKEEDLIDREVLEQMYRMIYLAQIETALYAISLLLELNIATKMRCSDRYYTMVYKKMTDLEITKAKHSNINLYFNILHRSIESDPNTNRAQAFVKRLLQIGLYWPSNKACGALIMISKILRRRPTIRNDGLPFYDKTSPEEDDKDNVKLKNQHVRTNGYDPRHRNPLFAGAQYSVKYELDLYRDHFHPSVRVFAEDLLNGKPMTYYGDPIADFHVTRFLDRFSFKNPAKKKALDPNKLQGSRKLAVKDLNDQNVVEEEKFLLQYTKNDKEIKAKRVKPKKEDDSDAEDDNVSESGSVNDEEFDAYLDSLGAAGGKNDIVDDFDDDLDFMGEVSKPATKKRKHASDDEESGQDDWDVSDNEDGADKPEKKKLKFDVDEGEISDDGSISLDDEDEIMDGSDSDDDASVIMDESGDDSDSESDEDQQSGKKKNKLSIAKKLKKKLKDDDMDSLFMGTDEFAEMLEASAKGKHHGTSDDIRNQDKSSAKQMKWESGRMQDLDELKKRKFNPHKNGARKIGGRPFEKKDGAGRKFGKKPGFKKDFKKTFKPAGKNKNFKQPAKFNRR